MTVWMVLLLMNKVVNLAPVPYDISECNRRADLANIWFQAEMSDPEKAERLHKDYPGLIASEFRFACYEGLQPQMGEQGT